MPPSGFIRTVWGSGERTGAPGRVARLGGNLQAPAPLPGRGSARGARPGRPAARGLVGAGAALTEEKAGASGSASWARTAGATPAPAPARRPSGNEGGKPPLARKLIL